MADPRTIWSTQFYPPPWAVPWTPARVASFGSDIAAQLQATLSNGEPVTRELRAWFECAVRLTANAVGGRPRRSRTGVQNQEPGALVTRRRENVEAAFGDCARALAVTSGANPWTAGR